MNCTQCGFEASADFAFCPKCGTKLPVRCGTCGFHCDPDFAFCPRCGSAASAQSAGAAPAPGSPIQPAQPQHAPEAIETDRRPVSVLFADLCGFTTLCERLDPEEIRDLQAELFEEMAAAVRDYDGYIERFVGDSLLALFGAPTAHENDPERALEAALAMCERTTRLSSRWSNRTERSLALHVGINTGPAVVGSVGSGSAQAYSVTGDTANTAARLQAAAGEGDILVGPTTYRLTQDTFDFEPVGELTLKGKAQPLPAYRLLGARRNAHGARTLEALGLGPCLVGREQELAQMRAAFERTMSGHAQVVRLVGEAGVGKTRLLQAFLESLEASGELAGKTLRRAACSALGGQPYGFLATILHEGYAIAPDAPLDVAQRKLKAGLQELGADEAEMAQIAPLLGYVLGLEPGELGLRHVTPEQLKRQIFLAVQRLFEFRIGHSPLLLIVEDLQWADAASVELLHFLVDRLHDRAFMLIVSHRPSSDASVLTSVRATHNAMRIAPLSEQETEALLGALFAGGQLPQSVRAAIVARAGGIPLYVEEIVRGLIEEDVLQRTEGAWHWSSDKSIDDIPLTIQGLLLARLDRLPRDARRLAQEAAVLGPEFNGDVLHAITSDPDAMDRCLERLIDTELLVEVANEIDVTGERSRTGTRYRFTQTLLQEVIYQNLLLQRRSELHGRAGRALENAHGTQPERLEDIEALGHHFALSGERLKGARYLTRAGDWARNIYANDDAYRHYRRALTALEATGEASAERLTACERLGDLLGPMGHREEALTHYEAVLRMAVDIGDAAAQARLLRKLAWLHWEAGERELAWKHCHQALSLLGEHSAHIELAHLYQEMGRLAFRDGDHRRAAEWAQRALAQVQTLAGGSLTEGNPGDEGANELALALALANNTLGVALARMGRLNEAVTHVEESVRVSETNDLLHAACRAYSNLGVLYSVLNPRQAIESCRDGLVIAERIGDLGFQSRLSANLAVAYCTFTDRCEVDGIKAAQRAADLDRQLGLRDHLAVPLVVLGQIYQCRGDLPRALDYYREAMAIAEETQEAQLLFPCYDGMATVHLDMDDEAQAEHYWERARMVCEQAGIKPDELIVLPFLF